MAANKQNDTARSYSVCLCLRNSPHAEKLKQCTSVIRFSKFVEADSGRKPSVCFKNCNKLNIS